MNAPRTLLGVLVVGVRPLSGKMSWTTHHDERSAERDIDRHRRTKAAGDHRNGAYRVNVRESVRDALCGPMGRAL